MVLRDKYTWNTHGTHMNDPIDKPSLKHWYTKENSIHKFITLLIVNSLGCICPSTPQY